MRSGHRRFIIIIITTTPFYVKGREVGVPRFMTGIWYGTSLVHMVWYIVGSYGMIHRWFIWYDTSLVYGMVHRWFIWYGTSLVYGMVHSWYMVWYMMSIWYGL